jgi:hypothetical protein
LTDVYTEYEVRYNLMPTANQCWPEDMQVPGFKQNGMPNPYYSEPVIGRPKFTPVGMVLLDLFVDVEELENMATRHVRDCNDTEDPDEPCVVCAEGADNSIYTKWVQKWLAEKYNIGFTEEALDLLWSAETSGLTLDEWLTVQAQR